MLETYQKLVYWFQRWSQSWWPPVRPLPCEASSKAGVSTISYSVPYGHGQAPGEYASENGLSVCGTFIGATIHADDIRTCATTKQSVAKQNSIITRFTNSSCLNLNTQKLEVLQVGQKSNTLLITIIGNRWPHDISLRISQMSWGMVAVQPIHIPLFLKPFIRQEKPFLRWETWGAFQGKLNPLSSCSIFVTCILPILLYVCETWILDTSTITNLERFQIEIGRRILQLPKHFSRITVRLALQRPSMSTRVLIHKLNFLRIYCLTLYNNGELISKEIFVSLASEDTYGISIIQQCRMMESSLGTARCLNEPSEASSIVTENRSNLISRDFQLLMLSHTKLPSWLLQWHRLHLGAVSGILHWIEE